MSWLENLIQTLCPDGVEFRSMWEITSWDKRFNGVENHKQPSVVKYHYFLANELKSLATETGNVKLLFTSTSEQGVTTEEVAGEYLSEGEIVAIPWGGNPQVQYYKGKFITSDNRIATSNDTRRLANKFLYYWMQSKMSLIDSFYRGSGIKHPSMARVLDIKVPVPPLQVQEEIVRILDTFSGVVAELEQQLEAELAARTKQYQHYRDELLDFTDDHSVSCISLESVIISLKTGLNPRKNFQLNTKDAKNHYVTVRELAGKDIRIFDKTDKVNDEALRLINNRSNLEVNDILFSGTGTVGRTAIVQEPPNNWNIKEGVYVIKPKTKKINPFYLLYLLQSNVIKKKYEGKIVGSPVISLPMYELRKLLIPLPSLEVQEQIVSILDRFDTLVKDLKSGLPAEIALRRKQYEYYRDRLLTFKPLNDM